MTQNKKERCKKCNIKLSLIYHLCKCGNKYCFPHRSDHDCTYDYKSTHKMIIKTQNPIVVSNKIESIV